MLNFQMARIVIFLLSFIGLTLGDGCSTFITKTYGSIESPKTYTANETCVYTFQNSKSSLFITINSLELADLSSLTFFNGSDQATNDSNVIYNFTESIDAASVRIVIFSAAPNTTVVYNSGDAISHFQLHFDKVCNVETNSSNGNLQTPRYLPALTHGPITCDYVITNMDDDSKLIATSFEDLHLTKGSLLMYDGEMKLENIVLNITDTTKQINDVIAMNNSVTLQVILPTAAAGQGFTAGYTRVTKACSGAIKFADLSTVVSLLSPGYPGNYSNNLRCRLIITSPDGSHIQWQFEDLSLDDTFDSITLLDGGSKSSKFLERISQNKPEAFLSSSNALWAEFVSDEVGSGKGFNLSVKLSAFGGLYHNKGTFGLSNSSSVHDATTLTDDNVVQFQLTTDPGQRIVVSINTTGLLYPTTALEFYEGIGSTRTLLTTLTSDTAFYEIFSKGNVMLVTARGFLTINGTVAQQQFNAMFWSEIPDKSRQYSSGQGTTFDLTYSDVKKSNSTWNIYKPDSGSSNLIALSIGKLVLPKGHSFSVYSGTGLNAWCVVNYTSSTIPLNIPDIYVTTDARIVYSKAKANESVEMNVDECTADSEIVFQASYVILPACGQNMTANSGSFNSPNYPDRYPFNAICDWSKTTTNDTRVHITFSQFSLAPSHYVTVGERWNSTWQTTTVYAGGQQPNDVITSLNSTATRVRFTSEFHFTHSSSTNVSQGFKADYHVIGCGDSLLGMTKGSISTPGYPEPVANTTHCIWIISAAAATKKNTTNILTFEYELEIKDKKYLGDIDIRDGGSSMAMPFEIAEKKGKVKGQYSRYDAIVVKYNYDWQKDAPKGIAFKLTFKSSTCSSLCDNGVCMRSQWRCDFIDQCGDGTDERHCTASNPHTKYRVPAWAICVTIFVTFIVAVLVTIAAPRIYARARGRGYSELRDLMAPVPT